MHRGHYVKLQGWPPHPIMARLAEKGAVRRAPQIEFGRFARSLSRAMQISHTYRS
jgi:hypothetical protein